MAKLIGFLFSFVFVGSALCEFTPIVLWHGMGDSCCNPFSLGRFKRRIEDALPGVHVVSLKIGNNIIDDMTNGFLMHPDKQVELACDIIKSDPLLANGYNAIGFSQGSQFLRALAQRCPEPRLKNLASLGGQHQGVYGLPQCDAATSKICDALRPIISKAAYVSLIQKSLVQATYWHDPVDHEGYLTGNTFLADINNEIYINQTYIDSLQTAENLIFVKFEEDSMVQPKESQWFGFYKPGQSKEIQSLQESDVYDRLGLNQMDADGKLHFLSTPGEHLEVSWPWFVENILDTFFR